MNRRIFSLICITLYALLDASIYCSQQKESDARNKSVRGTKEINRNNEKNDIEFKRETQLKNNNLRYDEYDMGVKDYKDETYNREYANEDDIYNLEYVSDDDIGDGEDDKGYKDETNNRKCVNNDDISDGEDDKGYKDETYNRKCVNNDDVGDGENDKGYTDQTYNRKCVNNDDVGDGENDKESSCFNVFKSGKKSKRTEESLYSKLPPYLSGDEMIKIFMDNNKDLPKNKLKFENYIRNIFDNDPEQTEFLIKLYRKISRYDLSDDINVMFN